MYMIKNDPINEIGITTTGMIEVRQSRRKKKITSTTSRKAR